jgi:hypothetical protein
MFFGICNAPSTFMRLMNDIFHPFIGSFCISHVDDILEHCYLGGAPLPFNVGVRDNEEAPIVGTSQEV